MLGISIVAYVIITAFSESLPAMIIGLVMNSIGLVPLQAALAAIVADVDNLVCWRRDVNLTSTGMKVGHLCDDLPAPSSPGG